MRFWTNALALGALCVITAAAGAQAPNARPGQPGATPGAPGAQNAPRFDAARFLKDHDKNGDGKLTKDELPPAAQQDFAQIDTNKDGAITQEELQQHAQRMAQRRPELVEVVWYAIDIPEEAVNPHELQAAYDELRKLDANHDGKIDESEVKAFREQRHKERVQSIFTALDRNNDGKISKDEARGLWTDNFAQLDTNKDGMLDRQEVEAACRLHTGGRSGGSGATPSQGSTPPGK